MNPDEKQLYGNLTVYRERGAYLRRLEQYDKAIKSYDEAYKTNPDDIRLLIGRSQACSDAAKPIKAYADAEAALKLKPGNMLARNVQARALFNVTEVERSLVMNHRGYRNRKQPPYFKIGIDEGKAVIEDCVGSNAGNVMVDFLPLIKKNDRLDGSSEFIKPRHVSRIPVVEDKKKISQLQARKAKTLSRVLAMKYLGVNAHDKFFLESLQLCKSIPSANKKGSDELKHLINEAHHTLSERQEILRALRPYYVIKLAEKTKSVHQTKFEQQLLEREREIGSRNAELMLRDILKRLIVRDVKGVMSRAERMQVFLDSKTPRTLPDINYYIERLYKMVGQAYLSQYRLSYILSEQSNRRRVAFLMGMPVGRPTSFDSVMANYPQKFTEVNLAIEKVEKDLNMCESSTMRCWLMYEMTKLLSMQKNYAHAKFYGKKLIKEATDIANYDWAVNGVCSLLSVEMQQNNINEIRALVEEGIQRSKKLNDPECVQSFLRKCEEMSHDVATSDEHKLNTHRKKQILGIIDDTSRSATKVLFRRISTMPAGRRFPVLPTQPGKEKPPVRTKRLQTGLTVVPGQPTELPAPQVSDTPGFQVFDL